MQKNLHQHQIKLATKDGTLEKQKQQTLCKEKLSRQALSFWKSEH